MELSIKERSKNSVTFVFKGIDISFLNLLAYELLKDKRVLNAYARKPHPLLDELEFYVLVTDGVDIKAMLKEKIDIIKNQVKEFKEKFEKSLAQIHKA